MEFCGIIRFFLQESLDASARYATKCVRVSSAATVERVANALVSKFHADMRMLAQPNAYALFEQYDDNVCGDPQNVGFSERRLEPHERPLLIQLGWGKGAREGRFVLRHGVGVGVEAPNTPKHFAKNQTNTSSIRKKRIHNIHRQQQEQKYQTGKKQNNNNYY